MKLNKSTIKIFLLLSISLVWASQSLSVEFFGGNLRVGFVLLILLALIKNPILKKNSLMVLIVIAIFGLLSSFILVSGRPIFYTLLLLGNFLIISFLYVEFLKVEIKRADEAIILHLLSLIIMLAGENILFDGRPHLFFKEPSYLGIYLSGYIVYGVVRNVAAIIVLSWVVAFFSISMFSVITALLGSLLYLVRNLQFTILATVRIATSIVVFLMLLPIFLDYLSNNRYTKDLIKLISNLDYETFVNFLIYRGGSRLDRMLSALHYYLNHTSYIFGVGPGNFVIVNNESDNFGYIQINNEQPGFGGPAINIAIEFLVEYGILALLLLFVFLFIQLRRYNISILHFTPVLACMLFEGNYLRPAYWIAALLVAVASQRAAAVAQSGRVTETAF